MYHLTLLPTASGKGWYSEYHTIRTSPRYTQDYYTLPIITLQGFILCVIKGKSSPSYIYKALVWTHTDALFLTSRRNIPCGGAVRIVCSAAGGVHGGKSEFLGTAVLLECRGSFCTYKSDCESARRGAIGFYEYHQIAALLRRERRLDE